ncbi:MAG TPA: glycerol-3-phosphate dehydrogenase [Candidatus Binataceae bacterium]|nr:glycerol-3-phosphate dehydrogenase [Candidatus Binataceae bacterium]
MYTNPILSRAEQLQRLGRDHFDLAVIGGGVNGAAIARDAAMRGLSVALVERGDFAGATSSRSSKLIHGGLRYLPQGQLRLVRTALAERERLLRLTAPHLVAPIRFLLPFFRGRGLGRFSARAGLWLYDLLARTPRVERHRALNHAAVLEAEPLLDQNGLRGGATYYDGWADDARITLENVIDAALHGAAIANYVSVGSLSRIDGRVAAASVRDRLGDSSFDLRARRFVNAAGPWLDDVIRLDSPSARPSIRLTKGVHLVVTHRRLPLRTALVLGDSSGRIVFAMPHGECVLIGTTDTDFQGDRETVAADSADIDYLLAILSQSLAGPPLGPADVAASFAGLRALSDSAGGRAPSSVSREEIIAESASGLLSVAGGKLTTHREIAQRIVDRIAPALGRPVGKCPTLTTPLPGARPLEYPAATDGADGIDSAMAALDPALRTAITGRYGTRTALVMRIAAESPDLIRPLAPGCPVIGAEVVHAVRHEMASTVADFAVRRVALSWRYPWTMAAAVPEIARLMAAELGWDRAQTDSQISALVQSAAPADESVARPFAAGRSGL